MTSGSFKFFLSVDKFAAAVFDVSAVRFEGLKVGSSTLVTLYTSCYIVYCFQMEYEVSLRLVWLVTHWACHHLKHAKLDDRP